MSRQIKYHIRTMRKHLKKAASVFMATIIVAASFLFLTNSDPKAAWFDDSFKYRQTVSFTHNVDVSAPRRVSITIDTATLITNGKMESDCADTRFTEVEGSPLRYQLVSGCNSASTQYDVVVNSVTTGSNAFFMYYGSSTAVSNSDPTVANITSLSPSGGSASAANEEIGPQPAMYLKMDEGYGDTAHDSTDNQNHATLGSQPTIRQEINIINHITTASGDDPSLVELDTDDYSGTVTYYFEVVGTVASSTLTVALERSGTSTQDATLTFTETSFTRKRSVAFTPPDGSTDYNINLSGGTTPQVKAARIIIIQDAADENVISATQTQIEIGNYETSKNNTTAAALTYPKYWTYNADNWDTNQNVFTAEVNWKISPGLGPVTQTYTTAGSSSWTCPNETSSVDVEAWGGGGGGGGSTSSAGPGAGGGAGAYAKSTISVTGGSGYSYTVGSAGSVSTGTGGTGGDSTFNTTSVVAKGGGGGGGTGGTAGAGGLASASTGTTKYDGGSGYQTGVTLGGGGGGSGGSGSVGNTATSQTGATAVTDGGPGGNGGASNTGGTAPASGPGGGGGGSGTKTGGSNKSGGAGYAGKIKLSYTAYQLTETVTIKLQEDDGNFGSWTDKVTIVNAVAGVTSSTLSESVSFTPTNGRHYRLVGLVSSSSSSYDIYSAKIKATSYQGTDFELNYQKPDFYKFIENSYGLSFSSDGTSTYRLDRENNAVKQYSLSTAWDISTSSYTTIYSLSQIETEPASLFFSSTGTTMYIVGSITDKVYQYSLTTAWNVSTANYASKSFSISSQETTPTGLAFSSGGTKMYIVGTVNDTVYQYTLDTAWDIATASYASKSFSVAIQEITPSGLFFSSNGVYMYISGSTSDVVSQYTLDTAWDVTSATFPEFSIASQEGSSTGLVMSSDGTKMYIVGTVNDTVYQYTLDTAWDIATASYASKSLSVGTQDGTPADLAFSSDGTTMYIVGDANNTVYQYTLSTAWDVSTGSYASKSLLVGTQEGTPTGLSFSSDGTGMYIVGSATDYIYQYTLSTAWDVSTGSYASKSLSVGTQEATSSSLSFSTDGTTVYIVGSTNDRVYQYTLSTAWDVSTGSYASKSFSILAQGGSSTGLSFYTNGTKMYLVQTATDTICQYTLSTAWDVSTAGFPEISISPQEGTSSGLSLSSDGTKMYIVGTATDTIYQYTLSTAWDISTASYASKSFILYDYDGVDNGGLALSPDGLNMYQLGYYYDKVYQYTLSTAWDISTASYASKSFSVALQDTLPRGLFFSTDGTIMYITGDGTDTIYQYTLSTAWDISTASYASKSLLVSANGTYPAGIYISPNGLSMYYTDGYNTKYTVYQYTLSTAWDISTATYSSKSFSALSQTTYSGDIALSSDGTKMYISSKSYNYVYQYTLSTAWDISTASYDSINIYMGSTDLAFEISSDGTRIYAINNNDILKQYHLSTAWDLSSILYPSSNYSVFNQESLPNNLAFSADGTKMYIVGTANDTVYQYTLNTAWDVTSASYASKSYSVTTQVQDPNGLFFSPTGTSMYVMEDDAGGPANNSVYQYTLSTAWDVSTSTYASKSYNFDTSDVAWTGLFFSSDGTDMYTTYSSNVYQYTLSTAWDSSTASLDTTFNTASQGTPKEIAFSPAGNSLYVLGDDDTVYQYSLSTAWDISTAFFTNNHLSVHNQETTPTGMKLSPSLDKIYILGTNSASVHQYSLHLDPVTKLETYYQVANTLLSSGTSLQNFDVYYDPSEWSQVSNTYYHVANGADSSTSSVKIQINPNGTPADISSSSVIPDNIGLTSSLTMSTTAQTIDAVATTNNNDIYSSAIMVVTKIPIGYSPTWQDSTSCRNGPCLKFDGTDDLLVSSDSVSISFDNLLNDAFTFQAWIKPASEGEQSYGQIFSKGEDTWLRLWPGSTSNTMDLLASVALSTSNATITVDDAIDPTQWHHVALTYSDDSDDEISLYIDGVKVADSTNGSGSPSVGMFPLVIGGSGDFNYQGHIDEFKIYPKQRTAAEIASDVLASTSPRGTSVSFADSSDIATSDYLAGYWKMDGSTGTTVSDYSGLNRTLNNNAVVTFPGGKFGQGASFTPASSQYLYNPITADDFTNLYSVAFWVKPDSTTNYYINLSSSAYLTSTSGTLSASGLTGSVIYVNGIASSTIVADVWSHVVVTATSPITADEFTIGKIGSNYFDGTIDEVRIYTKPLSSTEVQTLYEWYPGPVAHWKFDENTGTSAQDSSGNGNTASTFTGDVSWSNGIHGSGLSINAVDSVIRAPETTHTDLGATTDSYTVSAWAKTTYDNSDSAAIVFKYNGSSTEAFALGLESSEHIYFQISDGTNWPMVNNTTAMNDGQWHYYTGIRDVATDTLYLYVDGILVDSETDSTTATVANDADISFGNGGSGYNSADSISVIDDVRIYNYTLTSAQIVSDMNAGHPAPGSPIGSAAAHWKFDECSGTTANDTGTSGSNLTLSSASWTTSGKFDCAFNGTGANYVSRADDDDLDFIASDDFSFTGWFKSDSDTNPASAEYLLDKETGAAGYGIYFSTDGKLNFSIGTSSNSFPQDTVTSIPDVYDATWHHFTVVKSGTSSTRLYIDGRLESSDTSLSATGSLANSDSFTLGDRDTTNNGDEFNGDIDEVKMYRLALTADQVKIEFNRGFAQNLGSLSTSSSNTPDNSSDRSYCPPGDTTSSCGPVAYWKFDEGTGTSSVYDHSSNELVGTMNNFSSDSFWKTGKYGHALNFDSSLPNYISFDSEPLLEIDGDVTLSAWISPDASYTHSGQHIVRGGNTTSGQYYGMYFNASTQKVSFTWYDGSWQGVYSNSTIPFATWSHIQLVRSGTNLSIYINGVLDLYQTTGITAPTGTISELVLGSSETGNDYQDYDGLLDEVKIYNYALTPTQIAWDYNKGKPVAHYKFDECSGSTAYNSALNANGEAMGYNGTITIGATGDYTAVGTCSGTSTDAWYAGSTGKFNSSIGLDDTNDYVSVTDTTGSIFDLTSRLTVSAWVKTDANEADNVIISKGTSYEVGINADGDVYWDGVGAQVDDSSTRVQSGTWHHVVVTNNDTTATYYVDGIQTGTSTAGIDTDNDTDFRIGYDGTNYFDGLIDDVRVYNYVLTATQVKTLYNLDSSARF